MVLNDREKLLILGFLLLLIIAKSNSEKFIAPIQEIKQINKWQPKRRY